MQGPDIRPCSITGVKCLKVEHGYLHVTMNRIVYREKGCRHESDGTCRPPQSRTAEGVGVAVKELGNAQLDVVDG